MHRRCLHELGRGRCPTLGCDRSEPTAPPRPRTAPTEKESAEAPPEPDVAAPEDHENPPPGRDLVAWTVLAVALGPGWFALVAGLWPLALIATALCAVWLWRRPRRRLAYAAVALAPLLLCSGWYFAGGVVDYMGGEPYLLGGGASGSMDPVIRRPHRGVGCCISGLTDIEIAAHNAGVRLTTRVFGLSASAYTGPLPSPAEVLERVEADGRPLTEAERRLLRGELARLDPQLDAEGYPIQPIVVRAASYEGGLRVFQLGARYQVRGAAGRVISEGWVD